MVAERWDEVTARRWRLCLAVAVSNPAISQLRELTVIASAAPDEARFRADMGLAGRTDRGERSRLVHVDALIASAAQQAGGPAASFGAGELTWRVLRFLQVRELRLEGGDFTDRAHAVSRLRQLTPDQTPAAADDLFGRIFALAGQYDSTGAERRQIGCARTWGHRLVTCSRVPGPACPLVPCSAALWPISA